MVEVFAESFNSILSVRRKKQKFDKVIFFNKKINIILDCRQEIMAWLLVPFGFPSFDVNTLSYNEAQCTQ